MSHTIDSCVFNSSACRHEEELETPPYREHARRVATLEVGIVVQTL